MILRKLFTEEAIFFVILHIELEIDAITKYQSHFFTQ